MKSSSISFYLTGFPISTHSYARDKVGLEQIRIFNSENIDINNPTIRSYWGSINPLFYNAWDYDLNEPTIELCGVLGDANLDQFVDVLDVVLIITYIVGGSDLSGQAMCNSDFNDDGGINVLDAVTLVSAINNGKFYFHSYYC